jgi:hypothetical protein
MMSQGYIGVSKDADARFTQHFKQTQNRHLKFAIDKYGWDNLIKTKILVADNDYCLDIEHKLRPTNDIGWNCVAGGGKPPSSLGKRFKRKTPSWNKGKKMSLETRAKVSEAAKRQMQKPGMKELLSSLKTGKVSPMTGKKHTPESIEKMRAAKIGKPSGKFGYKNSPEQMVNIDKLIKANPWTCPHCQKTGFGVGAKNRWHFDNCKTIGVIL